MAAISISLNTAQLRAAIERASPRRLTFFGLLAMTESVLYLKGEVQRRMPVNTGVARGSVFEEVHGLTLGSMRGQVASPLEYVTILEMGRRPGKMPPVDAIQLWARRKLGDDSRETAWLIARAIGRRGLPAHHMFKESADKGEGAVQRIWLRVFRGL